MEIRDSVIIITGGAARVGREMALSLAAKGAHIALSYYADDEPWEETCAEIKAQGVKCICEHLEVRNANEVRQFIHRVKEDLGRVDALINNASVWLKAPFLEITEADWDFALDVNLKGPFLCSQAAVPIMLAQGNGVILNITDLSAFQVWPENAHHAASKAGLVSLTRSMAVELAPAVRVNAIAPGTVLLPPNASDAKESWAVENSLLKRIGSPQDVADLAAFILENDFMTGSVYFIDGGRSLI